MGNDIIDENVFCYGLRDQIGVLVHGTVVPCCLDSEGKIPLGNIYETSLEDILNSECVNSDLRWFLKKMCSGRIM
jgi:hypothetical protein